jgi:LPS sulfotransferase NodH
LPTSPSIEEKILYRDLLDFLVKRNGRAALFGEGPILHRFLDSAKPSSKREIASVHTSDTTGLEGHDIPICDLTDPPSEADCVIVCGERNEAKWQARARRWSPTIPCFRAVFDSVMLAAHRHNLRIGPDPLPSRLYVVCSSQRTGSTLLVHLLQKTGILGFPREQFRKFLTERIAAGTLTYDSIVPQIFSTFQTPNGVFGVKIHGHQYPHFRNAVQGLSADIGVQIRELLQRTTYISLKRRDVLAQAVSLWRARETMVFHNFESPLAALRRLPRTLLGTSSTSSQLPEYDYNSLKTDLLELVTEQEVWNQVFLEQNIRPLTLYYEDFIKDMKGTLKTIAQEMGLAIPVRKRFPIAPCKKLADSHSQRIRERFMRELAQKDPELHDISAVEG